MAAPITANKKSKGCVSADGYNTVVPLVASPITDRATPNK